jgi:hypothetical protein
MEFVENAREQLAPLISEVIEQLDPERQVLELSFFSLRLIQANQMKEGGDLLGLFLELSTTAFQGFSFTAEQAQRIDHLLAVAENISFALSASSSDAH